MKLKAKMIDNKDHKYTKESLQTLAEQMMGFKSEQLEINSVTF